MPVTASRALYIKLGEGNRWAQFSFDSDTLRFGFSDIPDQVAQLPAFDFPVKLMTFRQLFFTDPQAKVAGVSVRSSIGRSRS